ncbi:GNAT family N-acetyltransferase [Breznakiella homolactica]|uniref:GNAT family N-acetyltransferase n=1 Tax=Breznakiella homolactica TaxID=2798577 RepID=A0A7T8BA88_9SPIR|nr:GNAT family N-acetyltransferase [Breznakiella homolactica]QQO10414.1 UPF0158 family protein [Breznakiella homolactica]
MQFELTEALINHILFSMEDQNDDFFVDTQEGIVVTAAEISGEPSAGDHQDQRYIGIPRWESSDGFRLMERFAAGFKNPIVREELVQALDQGRGVFRAFKNALNRHTEVEQLWFSFKEREMRRVIIKWYNGLREEWGLDLIGEEPEETGDLILEDFRFRQAQPSDRESADELHALCLKELSAALCCPEPAGKPAPGSLWEQTGNWVFPGEESLIAETGGGDYAGHISAVSTGRILMVKVLEVFPEYRGLGIGEALLQRFTQSVDKSRYFQVLIDIPSHVEGFSRVLLREYFKPLATRYYVNLRDTLSK